MAKVLRRIFAAHAENQRGASTRRRTSSAVLKASGVASAALRHEAAANCSQAPLRVSKADANTHVCGSPATHSEFDKARTAGVCTFVITAEACNANPVVDIVDPISPVHTEIHCSGHTTPRQHKNLLLANKIGRLSS